MQTENVELEQYFHLRAENVKKVEQYFHTQTVKVEQYFHLQTENVEKVELYFHLQTVYGCSITILCNRIFDKQDHKLSEKWM